MEQLIIHDPRHIIDIETDNEIQELNFEMTQAKLEDTKILNQQPSIENTRSALEQNFHHFTLIQK